MINIPTTKQIYDSVIADLQLQYSNTISPIGQVFLRAIAIVWSAKLRLQYINLARLQKNVFVDTADELSKGGTLERFGVVKLGREPFQAVAGRYNVFVTGTIGAVIPASTTFRSDDNSLNPGYLFILDTAFTLIATSQIISLRALTAGTESKLNLTDTLTATSPIALVNSVGTVNLITVSPLAAEDLESYREKIIESYRLEPQGGAATDYRIWSSDAQGVKKVYPYATSGAVCEVDLFIESTLIDSIDGKGTPTGTLLTDVESVVNFNPNIALDLNERGRRPLQVVVNYLPVTIINVDININGFVGITAPQQAQLLSSLTAMLAKIRPYVDSADLVSDKNDIIDNNKVIATIINEFSGATFGTITIEINSVAMLTYTFVNGNIPFLNSVTYV